MLRFYGTYAVNLIYWATVARNPFQCFQCSYKTNCDPWQWKVKLKNFSKLLKFLLDSVNSSINISKERLNNRVCMDVGLFKHGSIPGGECFNYRLKIKDYRLKILTYLFYEFR